jgi:hypothetical protein
MIRKMRNKLDQRGALHVLPLLLIVAAVGVISFLLISSSAPFKGGLFGVLNSKPISHAATTDLVVDMAFPKDQLLHQIGGEGMIWIYDVGVLID